MKISVIIPCRNERRHIAAFLDSLLFQELESDWQLEVLVADGFSDDGTREALREYIAKAPNVRLIDNPGRIVSTGLNAAIEASTGDVIIRMDAHTTYAKDYVRECLRALEESGADNVGGPWVATGSGIAGKAIAAAFQSRFCTGGGKAHDPRYEGQVDTVYLGCWRRSAFERFGLFDPALVRNQDDEFNFRIRRLGGRVWQTPRIRSSYTPRSSVLGVFRQYLQYGYWRVAVIRKHGAVASWRHLAPSLFVASIVVAAGSTALFAALRMSTAALAAGCALAIGLLLHLLAGAATSVRHRGLERPASLIMPAVIFVYHFSYGLGFLLGCLQPAGPVSKDAGPARLFTALTR
jgi:succinoglycan biosynthesis protein ExoA